MQVITLGKYGRFAPPNGATSGYMLKQDDSAIIIDFGSGCMSQSLKYTDFCNVSAIILTHLHYDHMSDLFTLGYYLAHKNLKLKLFCPSSPKEILNALKACNYDIINYEEGAFKVDNFNIEAVHAKHSVECYSLKINNALLYTSDIANFDNLAMKLDCVKVVVGDACILDCEHKITSPHLSVKQLAEALPKDIKLFLAHLSYGDETKILAEALIYHEDSEIVPNEFCIDEKMIADKAAK